MKFFGASLEEPPVLSFAPMKARVPRLRGGPAPAVAAAALLAAAPAAALDLPPTSLAYRIEVDLDPPARSLRATEEIRWRNETGEPVEHLPLQLLLNAFSHERTTWMRESLGGRFDLDEIMERNADPWGYIEPRTIRQRLPEGARDAPFHFIQPDDGNPLDRTLAQIDLPSPVPPGGEVVLEVDFDARLPAPIARTGAARDYFFVAQWFPKLGVIEPRGVRHADKPRMAAHQFHGNTEFYADFADYDVTIGVPEGFLVAATGRAEGQPAKGPDGRQRFHHRQRAVHDFVFLAGKNLADEVVRHAPAGGGGPAVDVRVVVPRGLEHQIGRARQAAEGAIDVLGSRVGPYPYDVLTVVMMPPDAGGTAGMEYPTLITAESADPVWDLAAFKDLRLLQEVTIHEFGHQYFYGILASHEQEEAFLDEGFNSYWEVQIMNALYGREASAGSIFGFALRDEDARAASLTRSADKFREPLRKRPSWLFYPGTWGHQIYGRPSLSLATASARFGEERMDRVFAEYYRRFAFHHPDVEDFLSVADEVGGADLGAFLREAFGAPRIPDFSVALVATERYQPPLGRVPTAEGPVIVTPQTRAARPELGLPPEAREPDGRVLVEIRDPGFFHGPQAQTGAVTRTLVTPTREAPAPDFKPGGFFESTVRVEGPGWDNLPVDVEIRFADGAVFRETWDARATWREYRFLRPAPLTVARVDPARKVPLDVRPQNDAKATKPDGRFAADFGLWLGSVAQWFAGGLSLWL
jgi:hypothetical protein